MVFKNALQKKNFRVFLTLTIIISLLTFGLFFVYIHTEIQLDQTLHSLEDLEARLDLLSGVLQQTINSVTISSLQKPYSYFISKVVIDDTTYYYLQNGTTGLVDYYDLNVTKVQELAVMNLIHGGSIFLKDVLWDCNVLFFNVSIVEHFEGKINYYGSNSFYYEGQNITDLLAYPQKNADYLFWIESGIYYKQDGVTSEVTFGTNFSRLLSDAIHALGDDGGLIKIKHGVYYFDTQVDVISTKENSIAIVGEGLPYLTFTNSPETMTYLFNITVGSTFGRCIVQNFEMYGNNSNYAGGIYVTSANPIFLNNIYAHHFKFGFYNLQEAQVTNCRVTFCDTCLHLFGRNTISNCHLSVNTNGVGIKVGQTPDNVICNNQILGVAENTGSIGIRIDGEGTTVTGNLIRDCASRGIYVASDEYSDNIISGNTIYSFYVPMMYGIQSLGKNIMITGNNIYSRTLGSQKISYGISLGSSSVTNTVTNNNIFNILSPIIDSGTNNAVENNCLNSVWTP